MEKDNSVVILNTKDYIEKINIILQDSSKFKKLDFNLNCKNDFEKAPWYKKEKSIYNYLNKYIKPIVNDSVYYSLIPKGSQPGKMYGMAKNHKEKCPLRPVLSALNTPEYKISKWLESQLKPYLNSKWSINSNFEFMEKLKKIKPQSTDKLFSFDIKSLYTNVPLEETIEKVTKVVYEQKNSSIFSKSKMTRTVFKNLLRACSQSIFVFNGEVYQQVDGLSMGSPLAPLLANWFVSNLETDLFHKHQEPKMYCRYVDDIFSVFSNKKQGIEFNEKLNNIHKAMVFTMETSMINQLPFLDINIRIKDDQFSTSIYKKSSNTNVMMNYESCTPKSWKKNLIKYLFERNEKLVSKNLQEDELVKTKELLIKNSFPVKFIENEIDKLKRSKLENVIDGNKQEKAQYIAIPYIKKISEKYGRKLTKSLDQIGIKTRIAFSTTKVVRNLVAA